MDDFPVWIINRRTVNLSVQTVINDSAAVALCIYWQLLPGLHSTQTPDDRFLSGASWLKVLIIFRILKYWRVWINVKIKYIKTRMQRLMWCFYLILYEPSIILQFLDGYGEICQQLFVYHPPHSDNFRVDWKQYYIVWPVRHEPALPSV